MGHVDDDSPVTRAALCLRYLGQFFHQQGVILIIIGIGSGEPRGIYPGCAIQCIDLDPGVIGQRRQAGVGGGIARLDDRILDKVVPVSATSGTSNSAWVCTS